MNQDYSPLTAEEKAECRQLAEAYYWRFDSITFAPTGLTVYSDDQGGWTFKVLIIDIAAEPAIVSAVCMAAMRALRK